MTEGLAVLVPAPYGEVVSRTKEALAAQGFGVLTEIDVKATMKAKLDADLEDYVILGACNPPLAHQALQVDRHVGVLLPCNVVVRAHGDMTVVEAVDPAGLVAMTGQESLAPVAHEATQRLRAAIRAVAAPATAA
ncbi:MAG: DUF302 domain-containing protein [Actinomycetota bacterium]|nr:DUF302 domain-containing protein [Actinomycetota bacterium]